jgi:hypothetical protein
MPSCEKCPHGRHMGACDVEVDKSGILTNCMCFTALGVIRDVRTLRHSDAAQQRKVAELHRTGGRKPYRLEDEVERQIAADLAALPDYDEDRLPWEQA